MTRTEIATVGFLLGVFIALAACAAAPAPRLPLPATGLMPPLQLVYPDKDHCDALAEATANKFTCA